MHTRINIMKKYFESLPFEITTRERRLWCGISSENKFVEFGLTGILYLPGDTRAGQIKRKNKKEHTIERSRLSLGNFLITSDCTLLNSILYDL